MGTPYEIAAVGLGPRSESIHRAVRFGRSCGGRFPRYWSHGAPVSGICEHTFLDLKEERAAIVSALLQLEAIPAGMELFPAADEDAWSLIERVISASDYYLLVMGGKYGSLDPETEISYTEREFDFAVSSKRPVMAFLHEDPDAIEFGKSEKDEKLREKLNLFRTKVETKKHVKYWSSPSDLAGKVALSFANFRQTYPAVGWVRGDVQTSTEALRELNELRKQLERAEEQLKAARTGPPPGTEHLSQGGDLVELTVNVETRVRLASEDYRRAVRQTMVVAVSWDELFSALGPTLLDEAEQRAMSSAIGGWLTNRYAKTARKTIRSGFESIDETVRGFYGTALALSDDDFGTVLIQLRALGLLARSERRRSVSDRGTYWTLTPYGDEHLTTLRAVSRDSEPEDVADDGDEGDEED